MDFIVRTVILLGIIIVCIILASTTVGGKQLPPVIDTFTAASAASAAAGANNSCARVLVQAVVDKTIASDRSGIYATPEAKAKLYSDTTRDIDNYLTLDAMTFLRNKGIDTTKLPSNVSSQLPAVKLTDLIDKFQPNNVIDDSGNLLNRNECLIPMSLMKQFKSQTSDPIQVRQNMSDAVSKENMQCKIGKTITISNIPKSVTSTNDDFTTIDRAKSEDYGFQSFGCILPTHNIGEQSFLNMLSDMYSYTDSQTMKTFKSTLDQYSQSLETLNTAATNNINAYNSMIAATGERERAEALAQASKDTLAEKQAQTQQADRTMRSASQTAGKNVDALTAKLNLLA